MNFDKLKAKWSEARAVSPVIGVILMVAITVILAAVIGTFVLGLGKNIQTTAPTASITMDQSGSFAANDAEITINHDSGEKLMTGNMKIVVGGDDSSSTSLVDSWNGNDKEITAGESVTLKSGNTPSTWGPDVTIKVVWTSDDGSTSSVLREYQAN
ncbi:MULTISPECIES: type IV pilin [Halorussus]|uniref:type IV pilin n=1 Tax=Halorussus TaxID=1070314 RepID=UPI00209EAC6C|nr:type IV pilin N-terminal domain-containing protein [Halorussus vallis]USZ78624.1 type IV pilin N-terminal domain-containing protein [Halorussus vallis]